MKTFTSRYCNLVRAAAAIACILAFTAQANAQNKNYELSDWTTGLGAGVLFFEGDDEFNSSFIVEAKVGYDVTDQVTIEGSAGYLPFLEADSSTAFNPRAWHLDESQGARGAIDVLYHLDPVRDAGTLSTHLAATGGVIYYNNSLKDGSHFDPFAGVGAGVGYAIDDHWTARGDYRTVVVMEDSEINHHALVSLMYRWGSGTSAEPAMRRSALKSPKSDKRMVEEKYETQGVDSDLKTVYFEFDRSRLTANAEQALQHNAEVLKQNDDSKVIIEGHCDERGTDEYNIALGERRARSAYEYLKNLGVDPARMRTISYGEERPVDSRSTPEAWAKNRRVECITE